MFHCSCVTNNCFIRLLSVERWINAFFAWLWVDLRKLPRLLSLLALRKEQCFFFSMEKYQDDIGGKWHNTIRTKGTSILHLTYFQTIIDCKYELSWTLLQKWDVQSSYYTRLRIHSKRNKNQTRKAPFVAYRLRPTTNKFCIVRHDSNRTDTAIIALSNFLSCAWVIFFLWLDCFGQIWGPSIKSSWNYFNQPQ